jgi:hypothetical protein
MPFKSDKQRKAVMVALHSLVGKAGGIKPRPKLSAAHNKILDSLDFHGIDIETGLDHRGNEVWFPSEEVAALNAYHKSKKKKVGTSGMKRGLVFRKDKKKKR